MNWKHFPDSPYGDVEICEHGNTREPGDTRKICLYCDYPPSTKFEHRNCKICNPDSSTTMTVHLEGKCLRCESIENGLMPWIQRSNRKMSEDE